MQRLDTSSWLTKTQVCSDLGWSERKLEREVAKGVLQKHLRQAAGRRPEPVFCPEDVERLTGIAAFLMPPIAPTVSAVPAHQVARLESDRFVTVAEAAAAVGLSQAYIRRKLRSRELASILDGCRKVRQSDLWALVDVAAVELARAPRMSARLTGGARLRQIGVGA